MPFFILVDSVLPQSVRASDFRELSRVEFTGSLIIAAVLVGWKQLECVPFKSLVVRLLAAQVVVWLFVAGSVADALPVTLAASGAWMISPILLIFNVLLGYLLLGKLLRRITLSRVMVIGNLGLVSIWCMFQFGFMTFGGGVRVPVTHESWFRSADSIEPSDWLVEQPSSSGRLLMIESPSFYDFLPFVAQGVPVVAPADPKMRTSGQLQESFAFNYSVNMPTFEGWNAPQIERLLDFLGVQSIVFGLPPTSSDRAPGGVELPNLVMRMGDRLQPTTAIRGPLTDFNVYARSAFSAFVAEKSDAETFKECPVLQQYCPLLQRTTPRAPLTTPRLSMCTDECLWRFATPALAPTEALILPVSYDSALVVRDQRGTRLSTVSAGGFLATFSDAGMPETILSITLKPDWRMLSRVSVSYINLMMMLILVGVTFSPWIAARYRGRGRDFRNSEPKLRVD
jgi:hypothetical protein